MRIQTDIRAGTRTDKKQHFAEKVAKVEEILAADSMADDGVSKNVEKNAVAGEQEGQVAKIKEDETSHKGPSAPTKNTGTWASILRK